MKIKTANIITIHVGPNFGSNLQTIATCDVLKKIGIESTVINYIPPRATWKRFWKDGLNPFILLKRLYRLPNRLINNKIYEGFLDSHCNVTKPIYSEDEFAKVCPKANFYVTGSDQVWNIKHNEGIDTHYFWEEIDGQKIAFASSIGNNSFTEEEKKVLPKYLSKYKAISVREDSAKELLSSIGIESTHVLDPTFMLDRNEWQKYASPRTVKEPYLLVYLPYNIADKDLIYKSICKIAKKKKLKVVTFSWGYHNDKYADETIKWASPGDFLSLMTHADYVVTNSFHGTAFSINLNKQFRAYLPSAFTTRVTSIMDLCGVADRRLGSEITDSQIDETINYEPVNKILDAERQKALDFLNTALS